MKILLLATLVAVISCGLLTSDHFAKQGIDVKGEIPSIKPILKGVSTSCNNVALGTAPYNYDGVVKSGYLSTGRHNSALAFIFYGKEGAPLTKVKNYPTLIWLNGGPGSSSQLGNLMELGPFWIVPDASSPYKVIRNNYTWVKEYNLLFVDQPVGTGLSYADTMVADPYVHNMTEVGNDFYNALYQMYKTPFGCFPSLGITEDMDLFIFGESYAGKYVPAIAAKILEEKEAGGFLKGLRGAAIGDGFTAPYDILAEMGGFAYNLGLLDYQQRARIEQVIVNATFQDRNRQYDELHNSFEVVLDAIVRWTGGINVYDLTSYKDYPTSLIGEYFSDPDVKKLYALSDEISFGSQSGKVYQKLFTDFMKNEVRLVEYCLAKNLPLLIYNGQNDIIVETPGTMRWVEQILYSDSATFRKTLFQTWKVNGKVAGSFKKAGLLEFRIVNNAGHLVPMDQGANALEMVKQFVEPLRNTTKIS